MEIENITIEFYFKHADYISPITGAVIPIDIKKVVRYDGISEPYIISTNGVHYAKSDLTNFKI